MAIDSSGAWVPDLVPMGYEVFNDYHRYLLVHGARKAGKSIAIDHRVCRHLWENNSSRVGVICKTLRNGKVGVWRDLTQTVIPIWKNSGIGFKFTVPPKMEADSKMSYFRVRNMHGGESELQLHSLEHDDDVEIKFKDSRFSMIYLVEADKFTHRHVFNILTDQLRVVEVDSKEYQFIADTNPPEDGEDHWLHDIWFKGLGVDPEYFKDSYRQMKFELRDNPFISKEDIEELEQKYRYDKIRYARFVEGKWVKDIGKSLFADVYLPNVHVVGDESEDDPEILVPGRECYELYSGWDIGDLNHAAVIGCKRMVGDEEFAFDIIDELVAVNSKISLGEFVDAFMEKMEFWEKFMREEYKANRINWRFWSDSSSLRFKAAIAGNEALMVRHLSGGKINLIGVNKGAGSVGQRIDLLKRMLFDRRIYISSNCHNLVQTMEEMRAGTTTGEKIKRQDPLKHVFDALTYMLSYENPSQLLRQQEAPTTRIISMA